MQTTPRFYDFDSQLTWSAGFLDAGIGVILRSRIPGCYDVVKADSQEDKSGTDYWALRYGLPSLSVDVKVRDIDYAERGCDDLALETWSVIGKVPGWTRTKTKRTDYVLWYWQDTKRFFVVAFAPLCETFSRYWQQWREQHRTAIQSSGSWQSECVFVPRILVIEKLNAWQNGKVPNARLGR